MAVNINKRQKFIIFIAVLVTLAVGGGVYALTASDTMPTTTADSAAGAVSGYTVTNLHYILDATIPTNIDSLTFTISPSVPSTSSGKVIISATLSTGGPDTYTCTTDTAGTTATCTTTSPQLTADKLTGVTVVAAR